MNLVYEIIVDGKTVKWSDSESENLRFSSTFFSRQLTGKYSSGQTLHLQTYFLAELYKLSAGKHTVKLNVYVKSTANQNREQSKSPIATGELIINVSAAEKINHFKKWSTLKPAAKMNDSALSGQIKQLVLEYFSDDKGGAIALSNIKYFAITESTWSTNKNSFGEILSRQIRFNVLISFKDGRCGSYWFQAVEDYQGGGAYSQPQYIKYGDGRTIPFEALQ